MNNTNIHRILVPVDFSPISESAIEYSSFLANLFNAQLFLLHAVEGIHKYPEDWVKEPGALMTKELIPHKAANALKGYVEKLTKDNTIIANYILTTGHPAHKIAEAVEENNIDLIVMGTHGASGFEELFLGSNAHKVVTLSPCPVITIRQGYHVTGMKTIVLPIDDSLHSRQKVNNVLPLAKKLNATIHLLGLTQSTRKSDIAKLHLKLESLEKLITGAGVKSVMRIVKGENLAMETMGYAEEIDAEMLAIMSDHESTMKGMFMGAFAQQIVNHSSLPVLSIRPIKSLYAYSG
ncbi:MAG TPA: universal stress protein [Bacteroidia bacterium]|nr:universal stress protein [Bacteroidia bacterium]